MGTFGFSIVNAGQRGTSTEPTLTAVSTSGAFRSSSALNKLLKLQHGESVMFVNNLPELDAAITAKSEIIVNFCEIQGLDINEPATMDAIYKEFAVWGIAKGILELDKNGVARKTKDRLSKKDRLLIVADQFDTIFENALESDNEALIDSLNREGITLDEQKAILAETIVGAEIDRYRGSKTASVSKTMGYGVNLNFTDGNVWNQLKSDLGESATEVNRVFDVKVDDAIVVDMSNGYNNVPVTIYPLGDYADATPSRIKDSETSEE